MIKSLLHLLKLSSTKIQKEFTLSTQQNQKIFLILSSILSQFKFNTDIEIIMHNLSTSLVELIYSNENLIKNLSKFLSNLSSLSNSIINELLQTISKEKTIDSQGLHNISSFFIFLCEFNPKLIYKSFPLLIQLYKSNSFIMRNCLTEMIGIVLVKLLNNQEINSIENVDERNEYYKAKRKFIDILFCRIYDENSFSRSKTMSVFYLLCDHNLLDIDDCIHLLNQASKRIKDEKVQVRKKALEVIGKLIKNFVQLFQGEKLLSVSQIDELMNKNQDKEDFQLFYSKYKKCIIEIENIIDYIILILHSKNISDVIASMDLIQTLYFFGIEKAFNCGIVKVLYLIFSEEESIRKKVNDFFYKSFFDETLNSIDNQYDKLFNFSSLLSMSETSCMEIIIKHLIKEKKISKKLIKIITINMLKETSISEKGKFSIWFLSVSANEDKHILLDNSEIFLKKINLVLRENPDYNWIRHSIAGILSIEKDNKKSIITFGNIIKFMIKKDKINNPKWYNTMQVLINAVFLIFPNPDKVSSNIFRYMITKYDFKEDNNKIKLIFTFGHISLNMAIYLDSLQNKIKLFFKDKNIENHDKNDSFAAKEESLSRTIENMKQLFESSFLEGNIMKQFLSLLTKSLSSEKKCNNILLHKSYILCLCKLMCINENFCKQNITPIFSLLTSETFIDIKPNICVAYADFFNKFSNIVQVHLKDYFKCLRDNKSSDIMKRYIMTIISHLVLNDMLKLKGEIVDICFLLDNSQDNKLKDIIYFFLYEINKKGNNTVYNILLKAINRIITEYRDENYEKIKNVIKLLVKFIDKEKQVDNLLDKLFIRLKESEDVFEWRVISFCLCLLNLTDKHAIKFLELFILIREKIEHDNLVQENFNVVFNKVKKGDFKDEIETIYYRLEQGKNVEFGKYKKVSGRKRQRVESKQKKEEKRKKIKKKKKKQKKEEYSDDENEEYEGEDELEESDSNYIDS